ncbi:MAG: HD domain-containing protein [Ruminiclostridium sp.]|nr:HD domain-containing protein [Ruminiclostridium sp.]
MTAKVLDKMIHYFGKDIRRVNHALKVYGFAQAISGLEKINAFQRTVVETAAILHDIGIKEAERKYNSSAGKYQETEGPPIAQEIMKNEGIDAPVIDRVCYLIGNHHSYGKIDGEDFQILVEADFLVNIEEDAMQAEAVRSIETKYFKTKTGKAILKSLYNL